MGPKRFLHPESLCSVLAEGLANANICVDGLPEKLCELIQQAADANRMNWKRPSGRSGWQRWREKKQNVAPSNVLPENKAPAAQKKIKKEPDDSTKKGNQSAPARGPAVVKKLRLRK